MITKFRNDKNEITVEKYDRISWATVMKHFFEGIIIEIDGNVAIVKLDNGDIKAVEL